MREEDIFGTESDEARISFEGNRFCFAIAKKCALYKYDKKIGINFSSFCDCFNPDSIDRNFYKDYTGMESVPNDGEFLKVTLYAFNFNTNSYDPEPFQLFLPIEMKKWSTMELKLNASNINDESKVRVKANFEVLVIRTVAVGFLGRKRETRAYCLPCNETFELTSVISKEVTPAFNQSNNNGFRPF